MKALLCAGHYMSASCIERTACCRKWEHRGASSVTVVRSTCNAGEMQEIRFDPTIERLEGGRGSLLSIPAWSIRGQKELGRLQSIESRSDLSEGTQHACRDTGLANM